MNKSSFSGPMNEVLGEWKEEKISEERQKDLKDPSLVTLDLFEGKVVQGNEVLRDNKEPFVESIFQ